MDKTQRKGREGRQKPRKGRGEQEIESDSATEMA